MPNFIGTPNNLKLLNKNLINEVIKLHGPITKQEIVKKTKLSLVTVNKVVGALLTDNKIIITGKNPSTGGRYALSYAVNKDVSRYLGVYYSKNEFIGVIANSVGEIIGEYNFAARTENSELVFADLYCCIDKLIKKCNRQKIAGIGLGLPGVVKNGVVSNIPAIPSWENLNIKNLVEGEYRYPVVMENDINVATMGLSLVQEWHNHNNFSLLYLDEGTSAGIVINKELYKGHSAFAGELGNLSVMDNSIDASITRNGSQFENTVEALRDDLKGASENDRNRLMEIFRTLVVEALVIIICMINPEAIAIKCDLLIETDIIQIHKQTEQIVGEANMPNLVLLGDLKQYFMVGLIALCIKKTAKVFTLTNGKRIM
jgi:predicted NBD/HSP70 family sugar kinase